ncbi:branched-chain amino acid ABC transporter permease [Egibacter rhizosphaerae]|uniref:Branched-chain amino acid ABC transporter permease n=1 Tax=Egibacter rhizosphaerae TaxID=1670831 RepID=A0A411YIG2_9ACTN|nr:branched-chain amino acid ABC transporter permease [Egibacter rhizosphaerae]QBI20862.1 branched-chain amino acid ABC transporter permease [Egibacter rhizosphaerae]
MLELVAQVVISGVLLGAVYTLMAVGLSIALGVMRIINVAHTTFIILGTYVGWQVWRIWEVNPMLTLLVLAPLFFGLGYAIARWIVQPLARMDPTMTVVALFGVLLVIETVIAIVWTADTRAVTVGYAGMQIDLGVASVSTRRVVAGAVCLVVVAGLHVFFQHTIAGRSIRAMSENRDAARVLGMNVTALGATAFGLATATAAFSGAALSTLLAFEPQTHYVWLAWAFLVVVVGGFGSVLNTLVAGMALGLVETVLNLFLGFEWAYLAIYALLGIALLLTGEGLLGKATATRRI